MRVVVTFYKPGDYNIDLEPEPPVVYVVPSEVVADVAHGLAASV